MTAATRGRRLPALLLALLVLVGVVGVGDPAAAQERSASIDAIDVEATLHPDGRLEVVERVTYTFRGADSQPFTVGTRSFQPSERSGRITSIAAYDEDGQRLDTLVQTPELFEWDIAPARSGTRTYELRYEVVDGVEVGSDVVDLYRQWIGTDGPSVGSWTARVTVPEGAGRLRGWAHGPLDGVIEVEDPIATARVDGVPAGQFVETRLAVPVERFDVPPGDAELLPAILDEEGRLADEANARRDEQRRREELREDVARALDVLVVPLVALGGWGFWMIWRRWGKDPKRPEDLGDYWREVPDDPPAVAAALLSWGTIGADAYSATLLDLARRGHLRIEEYTVERLLRRDEVQHRFVRTPPPQDQLRPFERRLLDWLFEDGPVTTQEELVDRNKSDQKAAHRTWTSFQREVKEDLDARRYVARGKTAAFLLHGLIVVLLVALAVGALLVEAWVAAGVAGVAALVLLPLGILHRSRTPAGARRYHEWKGLQRYMEDFSRLDEAPAGHLVLWEQYLVAAVALGVAEELLEGLEVWFPEVLQEGPGAMAPWYVGVAGRSGAHGRLGSIGDFGSSVGGAAISSATPQSSGSGAGGGFSAGGGGGGGGGSFGAR
ncbi:DUF2207 domain-containing protein [Actinomarinicola tropica]|uniref:DUF2207 domain-containing protein n=1 Tax=Actinomarinicola tropica TaxID=2789776 RepID=UPI001899189A|nr:DUF2207 domain-containing protein [Actinomarinicola tropica]